MNVVAGMGIVGRALAVMISRVEVVTGIDIAEQSLTVQQADTLHLCYPYSEQFISEAVRYVRMLDPELCVVHSTVVPGTTEKIAERVTCQVAYSPVRGRHNSMERDLQEYAKFVAGTDDAAHVDAVRFLEHVGFRVKMLRPPHALELAKLFETTYSGLLITWAQEMDRFSQMANADYFDVARFLAEIDYLPPVVFQPGHIGGNCIISNLKLLEKVKPSLFIKCIQESNALVKPGKEQLYPVKHGVKM